MRYGLKAEVPAWQTGEEKDNHFDLVTKSLKWRHWEWPASELFGQNQGLRTHKRKIEPILNSS